jgi:micrococcal nuclease
MKSTTAIIVTIAIVLLVMPAIGQRIDQNTLTGTVTHVRDGDTIEVADVPVRLNGVAAPELNERFGRESKAFMAQLVSGKTVTCELNGEQNYDRMIGTCYLDGEDIGAAVISAGLARDCPWFSGGRYDADNTVASRRLPLPGYC